VRAAAAAAGIVLAATVGCGSSRQPLHVVVARVGDKALRCTVKVYLADSAGRATRKAVERTALRQRGVTSIVYISKKVTLKRLSKEYPGMTSSLAYNPLPDEYDVAFDDVVDAAIGADHLRLPRTMRVVRPSYCP
jgi:cell division protein FtsX